MQFFNYAQSKSIEVLKLYWELVLVIVPVAVATQVLVETGILAAIAPAFEPVMGWFGLSPELAFAWITGLTVGIWAAVVVLFTVTSPADISVADMTVFSSLLLFAHALPIEQRIIQRVGPGFWVTLALRLFGGMVYAFLLHQTLAAGDFLNQPISPLWLPDPELSGWTGFVVTTVESLFWMLIVLAALAFAMDGLKWSGLLDRLNRVIAPLFRPIGIRQETGPLVAVGLLLGITFGSGLLLREARAGHLSPRQLFLACVYMGFAHSVIEDTAVVMALGADFTGVFVGRLIFAFVATGLIALLLHRTPEHWFQRLLFNPSPTPAYDR